MGTLIIKTNASHPTDFLIADVGIFIPAFGGSETFDTELDKDRILYLQISTSLINAVTDDAYGTDSSTLILNDGSVDIDQHEARSFLANIYVRATTGTVLAEDGSFVYIGDGEVLTVV